MNETEERMPKHDHRTELFFIELLRMYAGTATQLSETPSDEEWQGIYELAQKHAVNGLLYRVLERHADKVRPPRQVLFNLYAQASRIKQRNEHLCYLNALCVQKFGEKGFRSAILKGMGVACYYPDPLLRISGDVDLWVEGGRERIMRFLRTKGCQVGETVYHHTHANLLRGAELELHFRPTWLWNPFDNFTLQQWMEEQGCRLFRTSTLLPDGKSQVPCPPPAFNRIYLLLHIYRHLFEEGVGIRHLFDYYFCLMQPATSAELDETRRRLAEWHLTAFAGAVMYVLQRIFLMPDSLLLVPADEVRGRQLLREVMLAGNFGHFDERLHIPENETHWHKLVSRVRRNLAFLRHYPREVAWEVPFKVTHFIWRKCKGYV